MDNDIKILLIMIMLLSASLVYLINEAMKQSEKEGRYREMMLEGFNKLDCKEKGDMMLKQHLDGNSTLVSKMIPVFTESQCQFDTASKIVLGATP